MRRGVLSLLIATLVAAGCGRAEFLLTSTAEELVSDVMATGAEPHVADCVRGLAIQDERLTTIDLDDPIDSAYVEDLRLSCERAAMLAEPAPETPEEIPFAGPHTYGDDPELDALWEACELGDGTKCDVLFETAPVDSDYETFGVTCGNREGILNCSEIEPVEG